MLQMEKAAQLPGRFVRRNCAVCDLVVSVVFSSFDHAIAR